MEGSPFFAWILAYERVLYEEEEFMDGNAWVTRNPRYGRCKSHVLFMVAVYHLFSRDKAAFRGMMPGVLLLAPGGFHLYLYSDRGSQ